MVTGEPGEGLPDGSPVPPAREEEPQRPAEKRYGRVRLVAEDVPVGKIADVNRGVFIPLSQVTSDLKFSMAFDFTSEEGVSESTLENVVKETLRQIGARVVEEEETE